MPRGRKVDWIIVGELGHRKSVFWRSVILVTQAKVESQARCRLPVILEEISLAEEVGMVNGDTELAVESAALSSKIIQKVGEGCHPGAACISERSAFVKGRMLAGQLPQVVHSKAEGVLTTHHAHGLLILPVIREPKLRDVCSYTERADSVAKAAVVGQVEVESICSHPLKIKADAPVIKAEFIGPGGIDYVGIGKQAAHGGAGEAIVKTRQIVQPIWALRRFVIEPAEAH